MTALQERLSSLPTSRAAKPLARPLKSFDSAPRRMPAKLADRHQGPVSAVDLSPVQDLTTRTRSVAVREMTVRLHVPRPTHVPTLEKQKRFPVASIDFSKKDVGLPYGVPRKVTAATLKQLAGGTLTDQLLKSTRSGWAFVPDSTLIDLTDNSAIYKVAGLTIFS